ncbi:MAG: hypothetical protein Q9169_001207 [Polycauliona sp. 2 TL-2023]
MDNELDLMHEDMLGQADHSEQIFHSTHPSITSGSGSVAMANGGDSSSATPAVMGLQKSAEENPNSSHSEPVDRTPPYPHNDFDHPGYQKIDEPENRDGVCEGPLPDSSTETKQEVAPTAIMTSSTSADFPDIHHVIDPDPGPFALERVLSAPVSRSANWRSDDSDDLYVSHPRYDPLSSMSGANPFTGWNGQHLPSHGNDHRARAHTYNTGPTSQPRQCLANLNPSTLSNADAAYHMMRPYSNQTRLSSNLANNGAGNYEVAYSAGKHYEMPAFNPTVRKFNRYQTNSNSNQHNNHDGPLYTGYNDDFHKKPQQFTLKSQPLIRSSNIGQLAISQLRGATKAQSHQDHMDEQKEVSQDLHYHNIESARQAERPKFKINSKKDVTIPLTDERKQQYVMRMLRSMKHVDRAEDNAGMITQWEKLSQDEARMEQAAWRLLDMALQIHLEGIPLLPNRPSCNRYASMDERWSAICKGLQTQKTMCKHLLGSEFAPQLVNDPTTAIQRVQNNRKVNAGKKTHMDNGRRLAFDRATRSSRRGSSASTQFRAEDFDEEGHPYGDGFGLSLGEMGDEDAEGDTDDEIQQATGMASVGHATAAKSAPAAAPRRKRELEHDDSDEYDGRAKKRRSSAKTHQTAPKRHIKAPRRAGDRSKFQIVGGKMIALEDKKNENLVYSQGSARVQEIFENIHYPYGPPSSQNGRHTNGRATNGHHSGPQAFPAIGSRQPPRQARPGKFQPESSTEHDDTISETKNEEGDEYYQEGGLHEA